MKLIMIGSCLRLLALGIVCGALAAQAGATGILNGDFQNAPDLEHWTAIALAAPDLADAASDELADGGNDVLYLKAHNSYTWDDGDGEWLMNETIGSFAQASNPSDYDLYAPDGATVLQFDAKFDLAAGGSATTRFLVEVSYNYDAGATSFDSVADWEGAATSDWSSYVIGLPGLDVSKQMLVSVFARSGDGLADVTGDFDQQTVDVTAEGWFDNFVLVPEPMTLSILAAGLAGLAYRRRGRD